MISLRPFTGFVGALALVATALLAGAAALGPGRTLDQQIALIEPHTTIEIPEDASGPVPAVLLFHGCGGLRDVQPAYADDLLDAGYAVITVDSNSARGIGRLAAMSQVCLALRLRGQRRAGDIFAAVELARRQPAVNASQLALVGWSHGGWSVLEALAYSGQSRSPLGMAARPVPALEGVRTAVTLYPYCGFMTRLSGTELDPDIPIFGLLAERDLVAHPPACIRLFDRAAAAGLPARHEVWPGITHAFDEANQPPDPRMEYNPDAAARARARLIDILQTAFADQG
ncbi:dienelactone hydrolase family protein [Maricaulis sp. CAU 1757]